MEGVGFIRAAQGLGGGGFADTADPLGYPVLVLLAHLLVPDWTLAARVVALVAGTALVPLLWWLGRRLIPDWRLALLPAAAWAFLPLPVRYALVPMSEAPYVLALAATMALLAARRPVWAGLAGGAAFAIRPEALAVLAAVILVLARRRNLLLRFAAGAAVLVAVHVVGQGLHRGTWTLAGPTPDIAASVPAWWTGTFDPPTGTAGADLDRDIAADGSWRVRHAASRAAGLGKTLLLDGGMVGLPFAVAGLVGPGWPLAAVLVPAVVSPFLMPADHPRFALPLLPFAWILAAAFAARVGRPAMRWTLAGLLAVSLAGSAALRAPSYRLNEGGLRPELKEAGEWLAAHAGPGSIVYDRLPVTAFYAGASFRALPPERYDDALDAVVAGGGDYLVVHQTLTPYFRPHLAPLVLDKPVGGHEPRLRAVYFEDRYMDSRTIIFRVVRPGGPPPIPGVDAEVRRRMEAIPHGPDHFMHGILAMRAGRWSAAAGEFTYVVEQHPEDAIAQNNRAWCYLQDGRYMELAEASARTAVDLDPENADFVHTLVEVLRARGRGTAVEYWEARHRELGAGRPAPAYNDSAGPSPAAPADPGRRP